MYPFRVFISYAHEDLPLVERVVDILRGLGLVPLWDRVIRPGAPFTDAIKDSISRAHVFLPLITVNSQTRPWVHQETGFAMGINIPVLPVAVGNLPGEMIAQLHAVTVKPDLSDLAERLRAVCLEQVVFPPPQRPPALVEVADYPETRVELMARYANRVIDLGEYGRVRHRGALTSFALPDRDPSDPIWDHRDGDNRRSTYFREIQREERRSLERHARARGCDLIMDPDAVAFNTNGPHARRARLVCLLEFLESMPDGLVRVAMSPRGRDGNLIIVGDWFVAEAITRHQGQGYRQTVFSSHPPTVLGWVRRFDQMFEELYRQSGLGEGESRRAAIARIRGILDDLPPFDGPRQQERV